MRALTLWRPWPTAILWFGKDIENRGWPIPKRLIGERVALHAGQMLDKLTLADLEASAAKRDWVFELDLAGPPQHIVGVARFGAAVQSSSSPWFSGPWGWPIHAPIVLPESIACAGKQGLWTVPERHERHINEQLAEMAICRECECYDLRACSGGCAWAEPDLCSACADRGVR